MYSLYVITLCVYFVLRDKSVTYARFEPGDDMGFSVQENSARKEVKLMYKTVLKIFISRCKSSVL